VGCLFSINTNGSGYRDIYDFDTYSGVNSLSNFVISGHKMYGMASSGGDSGYGTIFSVDTNGLGFKVLLDFNDSNGAYPYGSLILSGKVLYGMTTEGSSLLGDGNVFSIDTNGSSFKKLLNFNGINGESPYGSLTLSGGILYGLTPLGGGKDSGNIFSIDTNGNNYRNILNFDGADGWNPYGSLILSNGVLYGMTANGGSEGYGVIFGAKDTVTGINELTVNSEEVKLYPDPNNGQFTIQSSVVGERLLVNIYNVIGEEVYSEYTNSNSSISVSLNSQPNGVYLYRILTQTGHLVSSGKFVIQN